MSQKTVVAHVYGKDYALACDAGQEKHLLGLVDDIHARTAQLEKAVGRLPEPLMLLYTALMVADELYDTRRDLSRVRDELNRTQRQLEESGNAGDARLALLEQEVAKNIHAIAGRIDGLAEKLAA